MAVESLYCAHPSAVVTCTLLELESCFAAIDDKVSRASDYTPLLQVCALAPLHASCHVHDLGLQEIMVQSLVFDVARRRSSVSLPLQCPPSSPPHNLPSLSNPDRSRPPLPPKQKNPTFCNVNSFNR